MKTLLLFIFVSLLLGGALPICAEDQGGYNSLNKYRGIYKINRLYQLDATKTLWLGSKRPKLLNELLCDKAIQALREKGSWTGNLSDKGKCLGYAEAPTWASGNYLNYLNRGKVAKQGETE